VNHEHYRIKIIEDFKRFSNDEKVFRYLINTLCHLKKSCCIQSKLFVILKKFNYIFAFLKKTTLSKFLILLYVAILTPQTNFDRSMHTWRHFKSLKLFSLQQPSLEKSGFQTFSAHWSNRCHFSTSFGIPV